MSQYPDTSQEHVYPSLCFLPIGLTLLGSCGPSCLLWDLSLPTSKMLWWVGVGVATLLAHDRVLWGLRKGLACCPIRGLLWCETPSSCLVPSQQAVVISYVSLSLSLGLLKNLFLNKLESYCSPSTSSVKPLNTPQNPRQGPTGRRNLCTGWPEGEGGSVPAIEDTLSSSCLEEKISECVS